MVNEVGSFSSSQNLLLQKSLDGYLSRTFQGSLIAPKDKISKFSSKRWDNSGMAFHGEYWMQNTLEHHSDAEESTLSEVLEPSCPPRYFLNQEQLRSLLKRASDRGKSLPPDLKKCLENQISILSNTPQLDESIRLDRKPKDTETTKKLTPWIQEAEPTLYVRRLTPSECERLQGFPTGWTEIDIEP